MEKRANNSRRKAFCVLKQSLIGGFIFLSISVQAQLEGFVKGKVYTLDSISATGLKTFSNRTVVSYSGLRRGQSIRIPGEEISDVINKLWKLNLFSNVNFYITKLEGNKVSIEIQIEELPTLSDVKIVGLKKNKAKTIIDETELKVGKKLSESFLTNTRNYIINKFRKEGFLNARATLRTIPDTTGINSLKVLVNVNRGNRVKITSIGFEGNKVFSDKKLRSRFKKTKQKMPLRFWKRSKYVAKDYEADKERLLNFYRKNGYRDAQILSDTLIKEDDNSISLDVRVEEGNKYYFGDIEFVGNTAYTDAQLQRVLGLKKGDTYNGVLLKKRIADTSKPDGNDLTNLYQNSGYLFSNVNAVEVSVLNDTIDFEVRITEGKPAHFNKISVVGNTRTNDHVIYRELRTKPGELYSKDKVIRTIREIGQLNLFDAEAISPNFENIDPNAGTVDIKFGLVESGASQIELQGGYGGNGFIGTLGLSFNNFSIRNIFNKEAYKPLPMGDGQSLSLRLQATQFSRRYSLSFAEPWLGGRRPAHFSTSLSHMVQYNYNHEERRIDRSQHIQITGISLGLARRLEFPDDFFQLSQAISFQYYNLQNYYYNFLTFGDGSSRNLAYTVALSRDNTYTNPIFPTGGASFMISTKLSPPYSLFNNVDYENLKNLPEYQNVKGDPIASKIDQERFKWLEFYKVKFSGTWYTQLIDKFVLKTHAEFGFLGTYNPKRGIIPFERFFVGGDGMMGGGYALGGGEAIALRGYESSGKGSVAYNKFSIELRYPITLKPMASIYGVSFMEAGKGYDSLHNFNPFNAKRSAGFGIRIFMPAFGLLGIDFAYGFDNMNEKVAEPNGWETHFTIGRQF